MLYSVKPLYENCPALPGSFLSAVVSLDGVIFPSPASQEGSSE
jgi:hypothetical protein